MARRRALELVSRRGTSETLRHGWLLKGQYASAASSASGWQRAETEGRDGVDWPSASSTGGGAFNLLSFHHLQRRSSSSSSSDVSSISFSSSRHRGFAASARDESTTAVRKPKQESSPAAAAAAEEISRRPPSSPSAPLSSHWLSRVLPRPLWPYAELARLDKPAGTWLLAWPCAWSIVLASSSASSALSSSSSPAAAADALLSSSPDFSTTAHLLFLFGVGSLLLRGAGCTINDLWDREFDRKVARTASRPLARGAVGPGGATAFLAAQLAAGAGVLAQLNPSSVVVGVAALPLVALYPLAKRLTDWPQAVLGLTFNWGALLGWTAVKGGSVLDLAKSGDGTFALEPVLAVLSSSSSSVSFLSSPAPWLLYAAGICWTLCYDTIYAYQDAAYDVNAGVRSSALALKSRGWEKSGIAAFGSAAVSLLAAAGESAGIGCGAFYASMLCGPGLHMAWQVRTLDPGDAKNCAERFRSNAVFGGLVSAAIAVGVVAASP